MEFVAAVKPQIPVRAQAPLAAAPRRLPLTARARAHVTQTVPPATLPVVLRARTYRTVNGRDMRLHRQALEVQRAFLAGLAQPVPESLDSG